MSIVARSRSKLGGRCMAPRHKGGLIRQGDEIFKVPTAGTQTGKGQGPGFWVCEACKVHYEGKP